MAPRVKLAAISVDCAEPKALAAFYAALLGEPVAYETDTFAAVRIGVGWLTTQRVDDYRPPRWPEADAPTQAHLDFAVEDLDVAEAHALSIGASRAPVQPQPERWRVLIDPAGHPFCLTTMIPE